MNKLDCHANQAFDLLAMTWLTVRQHRFELFTGHCLLFTQKSLPNTKNPEWLGLAVGALAPIIEKNEPSVDKIML